MKPNNTKVQILAAFWVVFFGFSCYLRTDSQVQIVHWQPEALLRNSCRLL